MSYSVHLLEKGNGWNQKVFCNNKTVGSHWTSQDCTVDVLKVTCKRCLTKIAKFQQTEKGRTYLQQLLNKAV